MNQTKLFLKCASGMALGDLISQQFNIFYFKDQEKLDFLRLITFTSSSFFISTPIIQIMNYQGKKPMSNLKRVMFLSLYSPIPFVFFLSFISLMRSGKYLMENKQNEDENKSKLIFNNALEQIKKDLYPSFVVGGAMIPVTGFLIYKKIPPQYQAQYLGGLFTLWSIFMSGQVFHERIVKKEENVEK